LDEQKIDAPGWLRERLALARPERGKMYQMAVLQGFLEAADWGYFLREKSGASLVQNTPDLEVLFERIFLRAASMKDPRTRIITGGNAEHFILIDGKGLQEELAQLAWTDRYAWNAEPNM
jgi:hypothetical protein